MRDWSGLKAEVLPTLKMTKKALADQPNSTRKASLRSWSQLLFLVAIWGQKSGQTCRQVAHTKYHWPRPLCEPIWWKQACWGLQLIGNIFKRGSTPIQSLRHKVLFLSATPPVIYALWIHFPVSCKFITISSLICIIAVCSISVSLNKWM